MANINDVAKLANVSKGTVSNVFSNKRPISDEVKDRVFKASKQLGYTPNHIARSLVTKKTMTIGLKIPYSKNLTLSSFHTNLITGVISEAAKRNYRVLIDTIAQDDVGIPHLTTDPIDGVIILDPKQNDERISFLQELNTPFVVIGKPQNLNVNEAVPYVDNNNEEMVFEVTNSLLQKGHEHILFLNAPETMTVSHDRKAGFVGAFERNNLPYRNEDNHFEPSIYDDPNKYGYETVYEKFNQENGTPYTAMIVDTDKVALGALRALRELNINVPNDVSLIALSDDLVLSHDTDPQLTTVDLAASSLGAESVKLLFRNMEGESERLNHRVIVPAKLNERASVVNRSNEKH